MNLVKQLKALEAAFAARPKFRTTLEWQRAHTPEEVLGKIKTASGIFRWSVAHDAMEWKFSLHFKLRNRSWLGFGHRYIEIGDYEEGAMDRFIMWALDAILCDIEDKHNWKRNEIGL